MIRIHRNLIVSAAIAGVVIFTAYTITRGIWREYGGHNLGIALAEYVEVNDGAWPDSWEDVEAYHSDPVLGIESTFFVRQFWGVAWNIDPEEIMRSELPPNVKPTPVVYSLRRVEDSSNIQYWDLGSRIISYYVEREE